MLTETARVVAVEEGSVWVETVRQSVCGSCQAAKGCGHGLLNQMGDGRRSYLQLPTGKFQASEFRVDDEVSIGIPESLMLKGSALVYLLPLLFMLLGALLAPGGDTGAILGSALGLCVGFALVRLHARYRGTGSELQPVLLGPARQCLDI